MKSADVYWIQGIEPWRLAFGPRPRAGDWLADEVSGWSQQGIRHVVSLLEAHEVRDLEIGEERLFCERREIQFHPFPIADRSVPSSFMEAKAFFTKVASFVEAGEAVYIHCRAGIGRSSLVAAGVLTHLGVSDELIYPMLSTARRVEVPDTQAQVDWSKSYVQYLAGRSN
jgi:protein-tyrosine phosphatase